MRRGARTAAAAIHTATHFGAPLACAAALATLGELASERRCRSAPRGGRSAGSTRSASGDRGRGVVEVRGRGLMVGRRARGRRGAGALRRRARSSAAGYIVLTGGSRGDVLTLTPPLTIDEPLLVAFAHALARAL